MLRYQRRERTSDLRVVRWAIMEGRWENWTGSWRMRGNFASLGPRGRLDGQQTVKNINCQHVHHSAYRGTSTKHQVNGSWERKKSVYLRSHPCHFHLHPSLTPRGIGLHPSEHPRSNGFRVMTKWSVTFLLEEGSSVPLFRRKGMCPDFLSWNSASLSHRSSFHN